MTNQSKLKAWVRYDGTGRVVTAGPILQANKPKVGNWRQMNADLCCNPSGSTTTTTTAGGGGVTPTEFVNFFYFNTYNACNSTIDGNLVYYSASTTLQAGITVFTDAALTTPVTEGYVIYTAAEGNFRYLVGPGGLLSPFICSFPIQASFSYMDRAEACSGINAVTLYSAGPAVGAYSNVYIDPNLMVPAPYTYVASGGTSYECINGNLQSEQSCAPAVIEYKLSIFSFTDSPSSCASGAGAPNFSVYSSQSNPLAISAFYTDSSLTSTVSGIGNFVAYAVAANPGVTYTARISEAGVVTENTSC